MEEHLNGDSPTRFWQKLTPAECVDLVAWLLRRRLIIQIHVFVLPLLPKRYSKDNEVSEPIPGNSTEPDFIQIHQECGGSLLRSALPSETERERVLSHYRSSIQHAPDMLHLFLRILTRLPTHLEEIMFVESVNRQTLTSCMQMFSPFLATVRLPDPVTACFAGVEWS